MGLGEEAQSNPYACQPDTPRFAPQQAPPPSSLPTPKSEDSHKTCFKLPPPPQLAEREQV